MSETRTEPTPSRRISPAIPASWYQVGWSAEVLPGSVHRIAYFGGEQVLVRAEDGDLRMFDAFCPHFGAHLGVGGRVEGGCLVCPFHEWKFSMAGEVVEIPYSDHVNRSRSLRSHHVREVSGLIFAWYHPHGLDPLWDEPIPAIEQGSDPRYYPIYPHACRNEAITAHPLYVTENTVDIAHFQYVHKMTELPDLIGYEADGPRFVSRARGRVPTRRGGVDQIIEAGSYGIGIVISRHQFEFDDNVGDDESHLGEVTTICMTPRDGEWSDLRVTAWIPREPGDTGDVPTGRAQVMLKASHREVYDRDSPIWGNMTFQAQPAYAREEARPFKAIRSWAEQFFVDGWAAS